jgi:hypothetical protein
VQSPQGGHGLKHHEIERTLEDVGLRLPSIRHANGVSFVHIRLSNAHLWSVRANLHKHLALRHVLQVYVEAEGFTVTTPKSDLPQGTLDLLILQVVALGPIHGYTR